MNEVNETAVAKPDCYAVSQADAVAGIANYKALMAKNFNGTPVTAFTIRTNDFLEAMGYTEDQISSLIPTPPQSHARLYMGHDDTEGYKLYLVPVRGADLTSNPIVPGTDIIPSGEYQKLPTDRVANGPHVFDLVAPCPSSCDANSPLAK